MAKEVFQLIHEIPLRDKDGEIYDVSSTIISESKTLRGVLSYARMKKIDPEGHYIEKEWIEYIDGLPSKESEIVGHLNDLL